MIEEKMFKAYLFHPRYYPFALPTLVLSVISLFIFHFLYWTPLQNRLSQHQDHWEKGRTHVRQLEQWVHIQREINDFRDILPEKNAFPLIVSTLSDLAKRHKLAIPEITYQNEIVKAQGLTRVVVSFGVLGTYTNIRTFIRAVENADHFFIIEDLGLLKPGSNPKDPIQLRLQVAVYLKEKPTTLARATNG